MAAPKDTLEDRAWTLLAQIMGDRGAWGREEVDAVFSALSGAVEAERQRCMADVCEGCRKDWPLASPVRLIKGEVAFHKRPADEGGGNERCAAWRTRARMEKDL